MLEGVEKRKFSCTIGGNINKCSYTGEQYGGSLKKNKKLKLGPTLWSSNPTPGCVSGENHNLNRYMHSIVYSSSVLKKNTEATYLPTDRWMDKKDAAHMEHY